MPNWFRSGQQTVFGADSRCEIIKRVYPTLLRTSLLHQPSSAIGYRSARNDNTSYITTQSPFADRDGLVKITSVGDDETMVLSAEGADLPHPLIRTYSLMYSVLPGAVSAITVAGHVKSPRVFSSFMPGSQEHALEVCATLEEIEKDIFCAAENDHQVHFAIGADANIESVEHLLNRCAHSRLLFIERLDRAHAS